MTTTNTDNYDTDLAGILHENAREQHIWAPITEKICTREAQTGGGAQLTTLLNTDGPTEISALLQCAPDEAIMQGSIRFVVKGRVVHPSVNEWQSSNSGNTFVQLSSTENAATVLDLPAFVMNGQFQSVDVQIGPDNSLNAYLNNVRGSSGGHGALALLNEYYNTPSHGGIILDNVLSTTSKDATRPKLKVKKHTDVFDGEETLYHQLNVPNNALTSNDYDDHEVTKVFPRGMQITLRMITKQSIERLVLANDLKSDRARAAMTLKFDKVTIIFTCVTIPREHYVDTPLYTFATVDIGLEFYVPAVDQQNAVLQVTKTETDFVPAFIVIFVAQREAWNTKSLKTEGVKVPDRLVRAHCNYNGNTTPDFMAQYVDHRINMSDVVQVNTMRNAWLGRAGGVRTRHRYLERPNAEHHLLCSTANTPAMNSLLIVTDPSATLVREASGGILTGRLDIHVDLKGIVAGDIIWICKMSKQSVGIMRTFQAEGMAPQYKIDEDSTRPAYTKLANVDVRMDGN